MVQPCELIVGFTEHRWSSRALLQSAQAAGLPLSPALWASSRHTVLKCKEKFLMQVGGDINFSVHFTTRQLEVFVLKTHSNQLYGK